MTMRQHFAVFGQPIAHSLSPYIHAEFGKQCGVELDYVAIEASPEDFASAVATFRAAGGRGANITLPHKQAAYALCKEVSEYAFHVGRSQHLDVAGRWLDGVQYRRRWSDR
jgi:shikimate dehydrogenase